MVTDFPSSPTAWYLLGRTRLALRRVDLFSQKGALSPDGLSLEAGAIRAFTRAVELEPTFSEAAVALAQTPYPREGRTVWTDAVATLRRTRSLLSGEALAAAALVEREAGSPDSAVALGLRALATGARDSGVIMLELARDLHRIGRAAEGRAMLYAGAEHATAEAAYRSELLWVATPAELAVWDTLATSERPAWLSVFWSARDVLEGRAEGERLAEHYRRVEYALANYRVTLPQVGRSRSLSYVRPIDFQQEYYAQAEALKKDKLYDLVRFVRDSRTIGAEATTRYYQPTQDLVDDRGMVYIRHGPPTQTAKTTAGDALEVWRYSGHDGGRVISFRDADFDGTVGASVLVPTLLTIPVPMRLQICHLDATLCPVTQRFVEEKDQVPLNDEIIREGPRLSTEAILASRGRGRAQIDTATTMDSYRRDFRERLTPTAQVYGLQYFPDASGRLVVAFALRGNELDSLSVSGAAGRVIYPVRIQVAAVRRNDGKRFDLDTLRRFATAAPLGDRDHLSGVLEVPLPPGRYAVSAVFSQTTGRGAVVSIGEVQIPAASAALTISDIVLGTPVSAVRWSSGRSQVPLHPLNAYARGSEATLYFQLAGATSGTTYQFQYEFFRAEEGTGGKAALSIGFFQQASGDTWEVARDIGLQNLGAGRYVVRVTVRGGGDPAVASAQLTITGN